MAFPNPRQTLFQALKHLTPAGNLRLVRLPPYSPAPPSLRWDT